MGASGAILEARVIGYVDERGGELAATTCTSGYYRRFDPSVWVVPEANKLRALEIGWPFRPTRDRE